MWFLNALQKARAAWIGSHKNARKRLVSGHQSGVLRGDRGARCTARRNTLYMLLYFYYFTLLELGVDRIKERSGE